LRIGDEGKQREGVIIIKSELKAKQKCKRVRKDRKERTRLRKEKWDFKRSPTNQQKPHHPPSHSKITSLQILSHAPSHAGHELLAENTE
jgi:hypothetical protein